MRIFSKENFKNLSATYVVVILVFLFLFLQMVDGAGRETAIFRTFGATGVRILLMHFCEVILLTGLSTLAGCLLHAALYKPFFSKLNTVDIPYYFGDYVIVFAVIHRDHAGGVGPLCDPLSLPFPERSDAHGGTVRKGGKREK